MPRFVQFCPCVCLYMEGGAQKIDGRTSVCAREGVETCEICCMLVNIRAESRQDSMV